MWYSRCYLLFNSLLLLLEGGIRLPVRLRYIFLFVCTFVRRQICIATVKLPGHPVPIVNLYQRLVSISGAESRVYTITQTPFQCGFIVFQVLHVLYLGTVSLSWDTLSGDAKQNRDRFVGDTGGSTCCLECCVCYSL